jgi:hypothetical protein
MHHVLEFQDVVMSSLKYIDLNPHLWMGAPRESSPRAQMEQVY